MTFRTVVKEISLERGIHASFMPKPLADAPGSGMHTHLSLFEGDSNAFYEAGQEFNMSLTARHDSPPASCHHAAEICAVTDQYVNSYKRLWGGYRGTKLHLLGPQQPFRAAAYPAVQAGQGQLRAHGVPCARPGGQPIPCLLGAAGPPVSTVSISRCSWASLPVMTCGSSPTANVRLWAFSRCRRSLDEALKIMEKSDFVADVLGEHAFGYFLDNKHQEWEEYNQQVTPYELKKYLPKL